MMFFNADDFNGDVSTWDVSNVYQVICLGFLYQVYQDGMYLTHMFNGAHSFNGDITGWYVSFQL